MEFRILGPVAVLTDGRTVDIPQARQRALLAYLLLHANQVVPTDRLIDALWGERPPKNAGNALQVSVSRLRKQLPANGELLVKTRPAGYVIEVDPSQLDLARFEELAGRGRDELRRGRPDAAAELLREALALWQGPALAGLASEAFVHQEAERLEELRLAARELLVESDLARGLHADLVAELESLVASHPYREGFRAQLMLALYRAGRQAEALEAYQGLRRQLVDELGIEPSRSLQELERSILQQDPTLELPETAAARLAEARATRSLDAASGIAEVTRAEMAALEGEVARSLVELADARARSTRGRAAVREAPVCPFKGLEPFEEADAEYFFGRDRVLGEIVARAVGSRLVCVVGPSGSGKSSLLRAGFLPAFATGVLPGSDEWARGLLRPGSRPAAALASELDSLPDGPRVLVIDQLEEAFTLCDDERERTSFLEGVVRAALDEERTLVVAAVRADFYGGLAAHPPLASLLGAGTVLVGPMTEEELRHAVEGPASRAGLDLEPGLAETLVAEALDEPGALPLLQTALLELWKEREGTSLTLRAYGRTGGLRGAVARLAEEAYARLDPEEQPAARLVLLRLADEEAGVTVRRRVPLAELRDDDDPARERALSALVESRLVIVDDGVAEVAHEALFREWPRLRAWLEDDAGSRVVRRTLSAAASAWDAGGREPADLYRGARLASALTWAEGRRDELTAREAAFLDAGRAQAEAESERQRRANRRLRGLLGGTVVLLLAALAAGVLAVAQRSSAREAATEATAERLGAQGLVERDLDRSLLLARQAVVLDASPRTHGNLLAALLESPAAVRVSRPLSGRLLGVAASERAPVVVVGSNEGQVALVDPLGRGTIAVVEGNAGFPSADGRTVFVYKGGGGFELLDARTGEPNRAGRLPGSEGARAWHVTRDFDVVSIVDGAGSSVGLWRLADGSKLGEIPAPAGTELVDAWLAPDGSRVLTMTVPEPAPPDPGAIESMTLTVWDRSTGEPLLTLPGQAPFPAFALDSGGRVLAIAGADYVVRLHQVDTGAVRELSGGHTAPVVGIALSADGRTVATGADDRHALVWDARTGELLERLSGHDGRVFAPAFGPDGLLYTVGLDGALVAWDLGGERRLGRPFAAPRTQPGIVPAYDVSPDGRLIAFGGNGRVVEIRDAETLRRLTVVRIPEGNATAVAFSPDGRLLATGTDGAAVLLWDAETWASSGEPLPGLERPVEGRATVTSVAFSGDGGRLVAGTDEETPLPGSSDPDLDGHVYVWDIESRALALPAIDSPGHVFDVAVDPEGSRVAAIVEAPEWDPSPEAEPMGWAVVWSLEAGEELYRADADGEGFGRPGGLAFSPDGTLLAAGGGDGAVRFFAAATGVPAGRPVQASAGWVLSLDFTPDGTLLVTGATDGTVRLFDVAGRAQVGTPLPGVDNFWVRAVVTPDAGHVLSLHDDGHGFRWEISPASWSERACSVAGRTLSEEEWQRFLSGRAYAPACD